MDKNKIIRKSIALYIIGTLMQLGESLYKLVSQKEMNFYEMIIALLFVIGIFLEKKAIDERGKVNRCEQIKDIYMNATEEEKTNIFNYAVQFKHDK